MEIEEFKKLFHRLIDNQDNEYHPLVWINGDPEIGENVHIGFFSEVNAKETTISIGDHCDIASFVAINAADSHERAIGLSEEIKRRPITLERNVFVGSHSVIKGGAHIGHHSVVAAGTIVEPCEIPPFSLVIGNPMTVKEGYYKQKLENDS